MLVHGVRSLACRDLTLALTGLCRRPQGSDGCHVSKRLPRALARHRCVGMAVQFVHELAPILAPEVERAHVRRQLSHVERIPAT
jgi:hypothetical protein